MPGTDADQNRGSDSTVGYEVAYPTLKREMLRKLLDAPGQRMSDWPFQSADIPGKYQYEALEDLIAEAPSDIQAFDGEPDATLRTDGATHYSPNHIRLTMAGIAWARERLSRELDGDWKARRRDHLEGLRAMDSDDRRRPVVPLAFDRGMTTVSWILQMPILRYLLVLFSFLSGVTEGLTRSTSKNFWIAYVWRAVKIVIAIKLALAVSSLLPSVSDMTKGLELALETLLKPLAGEGWTSRWWNGS